MSPFRLLPETRRQPMMISVGGMDFAAPAYVRTPFLGRTFDLSGQKALRAQLPGRLTHRKASSTIATLNADHLVRRDKKLELKLLYRDAWLNLSDSRILEIFAEISQIAPEIGTPTFYMGQRQLH